MLSHVAVVVDAGVLNIITVVNISIVVRLQYQRRLKWSMKRKCRPPSDLCYMFDDSEINGGVTGKMWH